MLTTGGDAMPCRKCSGMLDARSEAQRVASSGINRALQTYVDMTCRRSARVSNFFQTNYACNVDVQLMHSPTPFAGYERTQYVTRSV